ncbi:hypothetical protein PanWU01x14_311000 [Parasponia andersonii]|uniref:Uncharacterized protein n=1 Tax=Parasponia andersonii TaxID=3476 RepID=A0A2P5AQ05_PARAD|nr:hypothetical protein PanWU01x14_311000 [Parasponia andersonii]
MASLDHTIKPISADAPTHIEGFSKTNQTPSVPPRFDVRRSRSGLAKISPQVRFFGHRSVVRPPFSTPSVSEAPSRRRRLTPSVLGERPRLLRRFLSDTPTGSVRMLGIPATEVLQGRDRRMKAHLYPCVVLGVTLETREQRIDELVTTSKMPPRRRVPRQELRNDTPPPQREIPEPLVDLYDAIWEILGLRAQRDPVARQANFFKDFVKLSSPIFDGKPNPTATERWLREIKKIFTTIGTPVEFGVVFVIYKLSDGDVNCWKTIKLSRQETGMTWDVFEGLFRD